MYRLSIAILILTNLWFPIHAHEMKAIASRHTLPSGGGKLVVFLSWGHRLPVDELVDASGVERFEIISPDGVTSPLKKEGIGLQENQTECKTEGLHTILAGRKPSVFTHVIEEDGNRVLKRGPKTDQTQGIIEAGTRYRQATKSYVVVGKPNDTAPKPAGLVMEITPTVGPLRWKANTDIPLKILLEGKPAPTADVEARFIGFKPDDAWCYSTETDRAGNCVLRPGCAGIWVVRARHKKLAVEEARRLYDFDSSSSTLTLEIHP